MQQPALLPKTVTLPSRALSSKWDHPHFGKQAKLLQTSGEAVGRRVFLGSTRPGMGKGRQAVG